ncbi:MAG: phytanoyl-CoA dioxygenase family protein [Planctomycetes bacterium]|nr:phytanoyl-CoA dioxygenase family protein [Planctomycetota bacterium]
MITTISRTHVPNLPSPERLLAFRDRLDADGFVIIPGFLDPATTRELRSHIDALAGPVRRADEPAPRRLHDLRHPLPGRIMGELVTPEHLLLARTLVDGDELRLTEQVLIRTDPMPEAGGPSGWHIDFAFHPRHLSARPRQTYIQMVHALSTVESGGGAVMVVPGSHHLMAAAAARLATGSERFDAENQAAFKAEVTRAAAVDTSRGIEIHPCDGDLILFHPMCLHSASRNTRREARYVLFMSFFDVSATYLHDHLRREKYRDRFPESLHEQLPSDLRGLLEH